MPRPGIIRADTLDLQNHYEPSTQDHSKHSEQSTYSAESGRPAPHQQSAVHHATQESISDMSQGPTNGEQYPDQGYHRDGMDIYDEPEDMDSDSLDLEPQQSQYASDMGAISPEDGEFADEDDMMDDEFMDKISSSPSIDDEDIDFEFVYALHNFVATVEGQANAAKGDTMVLLDDSNSYWWLVRVVKDGSIGYLPAEHIETPTERLARLNKHRNIDLSATMLGDNPEKSKNPLKKAMRRRNAKTVAFSTPTFIEASDMVFSSDDETEDGDGEYYNSDDEETSRDLEYDPEEAEDKNMVVEPLKPTKSKETENPEEPTASDNAQSEERDRHVESEGRRPSEDSTQSQSENNATRSRNGTVRNTDSFFKDDSIETKKISLTPNLLRDELNNNKATNNEARELLGLGSPESNDKPAVSNEKGKEDKKRKDKKPGMLSGLFKRKDKKNKAADEEVEEPDNAPLSPENSMEPLSPQQSLSPKSQWPQRPSSNQQQQQSSLEMSRDVQQESVAPAAGPAPATKESIRRVLPPTNSDASESIDSTEPPESGRDVVFSPLSASSDQQRIPIDQPNTLDSILTPTERPPSETRKTQQSPLTRTVSAERPPSETRRTQESPITRTMSAERPPSETRRTQESPLTRTVSADRPPSETRRTQESPLGRTVSAERPPSETRRTQQSPLTRTVSADRPPSETRRTQESPLGRTVSAERPPSETRRTQQSPLTRTVSAERPPSETRRTQQSPLNRTVSADRSETSPVDEPQHKPDTDYQERDVESPVDVSFMDTSAPGLTPGDDDSSSASPVSPPMSPVDELNDDKGGDRSPVSPGTSADTATWSDASLRSYLDDGSDIRDLFIIVHDKSNVPPAGPDHPISGSLFKEESKRLKEMTTQLDEMLVSWIDGKSRSQSQTQKGGNA